MEMNIETYARLNLQSLNQSGSFFPLQQGYTSVSGYPAWYVIHYDSSYGLTFLQIAVLKDTKNYLFTFATKPVVFSKYLPIARAMIDSFQISRTNETSALSEGNAPSSSTAGGGNVTILYHSLHKTKDGSNTFIVGELKNNFNYPVEVVKVIAKLYDSSGKLIDTDYTYSYLDAIRPEQKSFFKLSILDDNIASRINGYSLNMSSRHADSALPKGLKIQRGEEGVNGYGWYQLVGEVTNTGTRTIEFVKVIATFYNKAGKVIDANYTYTEPSDLAVEETAPYKITLLDEDIFSKVKSISVIAQSRQYAS